MFKVYKDQISREYCAIFSLVMSLSKYDRVSGFIASKEPTI
jgi:hypothetical protein